MPLLQAVLIGLVALILTPGALFYFDVTPKLVVLLAGVALLCFGGAGRPAPKRFSLLLLGTLLSLIVSTVLSSAPALSLYGSTWRRYGLVAQFAVLLFAWFVSRTPGHRTILYAISLTGAVSALYGIAQYFGWDPILPAAAYHVGEGIWTIVRPPGTLGYVSYFATWLLVSGFLSLSLKTRIAYTATALCWISMLLTGTRAALLGLAIGLLVWLYRRGFRVPRRVVAFSAVAVVVAAAFYLSPVGGNLRSRTRWFVEDPWGGARPLLWRDSLRMGAHRLVFGFGPETFTGTFPRYESKELARAFPDFAHESPHNIFLDAFVGQGIPGLICLAALCVLGFRAEDPWLAAALAAAIVAQQFTVFTIPTALIFYVTIALGISPPPLAEPPLVTRPSWRELSLLYALALPFLYFAFRFAVADHSLALARRAVDTADVQSADSHYADYQRRKLPGASADLWYSRALLTLRAADPIRRIQAFQLAAAAADRATRTAEDPFDAWYTVATLAAARNDAARTESALRRSIDAHPNWFKPHWTLAQLLRLEDRLPEALAEAETAVDLNGGKHPEVAATLAQLRSLHK